jgi:hypothetical protein
MSAYDPKRAFGFRFAVGPLGGRARDLFAIIIIGHKTTAATPWALLLVVCALFNDAITVALWTGFHVCLPWDTLRKPNAQIQEKLQSQSYSRLVRHSALAPRSSSPKSH